MCAAATAKRTRAFCWRVSTALLCGLLPLCGCSAKPAQPTKGAEALGRPSGSETAPSTSEGVGTGGELAAGAAAAAQFSQRHAEHPGNQAWQSIQRFGLTLSYPPDWQVNRRVSEKGPIALNTFESHYSERGGHFPNHGAKIDVSYLPRPGGPLQQIISADVQGSDDLKSDQLPFAIGGAQAMRASYSDAFQGYLAHQTVAVYVEHGGGLYKFFLTYHKGEALGPEFIKDFEEILKSVRFTQ